MKVSVWRFTTLILFELSSGIKDEDSNYGLFNVKLTRRLFCIYKLIFFVFHLITSEKVEVRVHAPVAQTLQSPKTLRGLKFGFSVKQKEILKRDVGFLQILHQASSLKPAEMIFI